MSELNIEMNTEVFDRLKRINTRPECWGQYTAAELWTDEHTSQRMLECHLDESLDLSSRNHAFIARSAEWIAQRFCLGSGKAVADFGCGPGLYTSRFARTGAAVTGIDFSARSLEYARRKAKADGLAINYVHLDYLKFDTTERFDLVTLIMCDFCALSPAQRSVMLQKFFRLLKPGGAVLLDAYTMNAFAAREEAASYELNQLGGFWSARDYYGFVNTWKYEAERVVLDKYTIVEPGREREVYNWLQYFSRDELVKEFQDAGFPRIEVIGDVAGKEYSEAGSEMAVVAVK